LGFFILALTAGALWEGGQSLYTALVNRSPATLSYDAYVQNKPKAVWLSLTNCMLDLTGSCYKSYYGGKPTELFIPVRAQSRKAGDKIHVLFATSDSAFLDTFSEMQNLNSKTAAIEWILKNNKRVFCRRDISGLVRFGIKMDDRERTKLGNLVKDAADDFVILEDGTKPSLASGLGFSVAGVMLMGGFVVYIRRNRETTADQV